MNASLVLRRIKNELGLPVLLKYSVVVIDGHIPIRVAVGSHSNSKNQVVNAICDRSGDSNGGHHRQEDTA